MTKNPRINRRALLKASVVAIPAGIAVAVASQVKAQTATYEVWFHASDGKAAPKNLLNLSAVADQSNTIDIDLAYPGLVPAAAVSLILTVERGWLAFPTGGTGCVSLRVMPDGYNLQNVLDRAKTQEWVINNIGVDVVAQDVRMPISSGRRKFFWALQSSHPPEAKKMAIIDLWGYVL